MKRKAVKQKAAKRRSSKSPSPSLELKPSRRLVRCLQANVRECVAKVELLEREAVEWKLCQANKDQQIRHLRQDCMRLHEVLAALIHRAWDMKREAVSAERLLPRLHYRVEQRFGPGGNMLVPVRKGE